MNSSFENTGGADLHRERWDRAFVLNRSEVVIITAGLTDESPEWRKTTAVSGGAGRICTVKLPHVGAVEINRPSDQGRRAALIAAAPRLLASLLGVFFDFHASVQTSDDTMLAEVRGAIEEATGWKWSAAGGYFVDQFRQSVGEERL